MSDRLTVTCPCCATRMTVDVDTGDVLTHTRPKKRHAQTLQQRLAALDRQAEGRDEAFEKALRQTRRGSDEDLLDLKFNIARKEAEEDD